MTATWLPFVLVGLLAVLAFWKPYPVLFMAVGGLSMIFGLEAPDLISSTATTTNTDIAVVLSLILFSLFCLAMAYREMFRSDDSSEGDG